MLVGRELRGTKGRALATGVVVVVDTAAVVGTVAVVDIVAVVDAVMEGAAERIARAVWPVDCSCWLVACEFRCLIGAGRNTVLKYVN